jgi:hypothetical protein
MTTTRIFNSFLPLSILTVLALSTATRARAQACSDQSLKGAFGYTVTGTIVQNTGPLVAGPFVAVGRIVFDGKGGVSTVRSVNDNGMVIQNDTGKGTYTMNQDCTGSFNITVGPPGNQIELTLDIVLDDTDQVRGVVTTPNVALVLEGRRQLSANHKSDE